MNIGSTVQHNTVEAFLRLKSMGFDKPWLAIKDAIGPNHTLRVRKWQPIRDAEGAAVAYCSPDLLCPFTGGMIVRRK